MKALLTLTALLALSGCDRPEPFGEEAEETFEAIRDGRPIDEVGEEAKEAAESLTQRRGALNRELDELSDWFEKQAAAVERGGAADDVEGALESLGDRIREAGDDIADATAETADDIQAELAAIRSDAEDLFDGASR